jgi:hypothetical protein
LAFERIAILHNTLLATFIKLLEAVPWSGACGRQIRGVRWVDFFISPPEELHERRTFCRRGGNPRACDSGSAIDS